MPHAQNSADGHGHGLTDAELANLRNLAAKLDMHFADLLFQITVAKEQREAKARAAEIEKTVDSASRPRGLSVRTVVTSVRQRQSIPLSVEPISDDEYAALSPYLFCKSRTLPRKDMLWRALQFAMGHARRGGVADSSVASWLSYEVTHHNGKRLRTLADTMRGVLSETRCAELNALATYAEQRAEGRAYWAKENGR